MFWEYYAWIYLLLPYYISLLYEKYGEGEGHLNKREKSFYQASLSILQYLLLHSF